MPVEVMRVTQCLRLDAPEWYQREDFRVWLHGMADGQQGRRPASWLPTGTPIEIDEWADVFITIDGEEGSDAESLPADIWAEIVRLAREHSISDGIVWISNIGGP